MNMVVVVHTLSWNDPMWAELPALTLHICCVVSAILKLNLPLITTLEAGNYISLNSMDTCDIYELWTVIQGVGNVYGS